MYLDIARQKWLALHGEFIADARTGWSPDLLCI